MQVAKSLAGDQPVVNAMQVAPAQQVMLEVRFLEASREAGRELGVNWQLNANGRTFVQTRAGELLRYANPVQAVDRVTQAHWWSSESVQPTTQLPIV